MLDFNILLGWQAFRNGAGSCLTDFMTKMSYIGEMKTMLILTALIYWCVSRDFGTYLLMGWSGNRIVNGLLKVTVCAYRPWIRDTRIVPEPAAMAEATGYSFPSGHSMNGASLFGGSAIRRELPKVLRIVTGLVCVLIALSLILLTLIKSGIPGAAGTVASCFLQMFYVAFLFPWFVTRMEKSDGQDWGMGQVSVNI